MEHLHVHVKSQFDADINAKELVEALKELGFLGCAITDHGVLSSIEDYRPVFKDAGLKLIPGCELYVDGGILGRLHLVVLAKNDNGYKGICEMVTYANESKSSYPVISENDFFEIAKKYRHDIIVLSACIQGVLASIFLLNQKVENNIASIKAKQSKYLSPTSSTYIKNKQQKEEREKAYKEAIEKRDLTKAIAEQKFSKRDKIVKRALENSDPNASLMAEELQKDKEKALKAKTELDSVKKAVAKAKLSLSKANEVFKASAQSVENWLSYEKETEELKKELKSEDELFSLASKKALIYKKNLDYFFIELQYHGIKEEEICYKKLVKLAANLQIPVVATNDIHILHNTQDEMLKRQILKSMRFGVSFAEAQVGDSELYLKSEKEMRDALLKILPKEIVDIAIANTDKIFEMCNVEFKTSKHYPTYQDGTGRSAEEILISEVKKGVQYRFPEGLTPEYEERLNHELDVITKMGYADYHLIVKDYLEYGRLLGYLENDEIEDAPLSISELKSYILKKGYKNPGFRIGPGRGSAAGSLVCYCLGITNLDPIKYGLLFERFLNVERVSMPDIDSDISKLTRQKVIDYVTAQYGEVACIMTKDAKAPKGALDIAGKYYGLKTYGYSLLNLSRTISKNVPSEVGVSFATKVNAVSGKITDDKDKDAVSLIDYLKQKYSKNEDALNILKWAQIMEGTFSIYSAHASGIIIAGKGESVREHLPLRWSSNLNMMTTQCDMIQVEDHGFLKFDFLGLKTLDIITDCVKMIEKNTGKIIDLNHLDLNDKKVYLEIFDKGKTTSVFQFESSGMKSMLTRFKPDTFEDLIILVSMFRPGPLQYLDSVIEVKNGKKPMSFVHPLLEPILGKTYGAIVYQEQVMEIFQKLAGYSLGGADLVRRAMAKKKLEKLEHEREAFCYGDESRGIKGCLTNGISKEISNALFDQMLDFASYAFNKSHAAMYALNAYITGYLKYYYPTEFFASAINNSPIKKLAGLTFEATQFGVKILPPSINESDIICSTKDGAILFGFSSIKGIDKNAASIIEERATGKYKSFADFLMRSELNITAINALIHCGALDCFSENRAALMQYQSEVEPVLKKIKEKSSFIKSAKFVLPKLSSMTCNEELISLQLNEGLKAEIKELTTPDKLEKRITNAQTTLTQMEEMLSLITIQEAYPEDKLKKMAHEKSFLGIYVTAHPMDVYPTAKELEVPCVNDTVIDDNSVLYGIITDVVLKQTKKSGQQIAFFNVEDKSGSIECCMFSKCYAQYGSMVKEGQAFLFYGSCQEENDDYSSDEEDEIKKKFFIESMKTVNTIQSSYILPVTSYAIFHLSDEPNVIRDYKEESGHVLIVYDETMKEMRKLNFKVNDKIKDCFEIIEM